MNHKQSLQNRTSLGRYRDALSTVVRDELRKKNITYIQLSELLEKHRRIELTADNLRAKLNKGILSTDLFLAIIDVTRLSHTLIRRVLDSAGGESTEWKIPDDEATKYQ
ncbi:DUF6471 domain-containing protein [Hahella ganghwensis]|uniref:DUF6471 domain-containing protein n=1 Tax=Hahella ganghwensis TaxID=286420 RepID=UPI00037A758D|nr:DUF6471 domain-containing protein [Hahella ganghwensis]